MSSIVRRLITLLIVVYGLFSCHNIQDKSGIEFQKVGETGVRFTIDSSFNFNESGAFEQIINGMKLSYLPSRQLIKITINNSDEILQEIRLEDDGRLGFRIGEAPILGMGEGGPRMGRDWRNQTIEFDRRGRYHKMEPRWQANAYGSRNPVPFFISTSGWAIYVAAPWVEIDLQNDDIGYIIPREQMDSLGHQQSQKDQQKNLGKGIPPAGKYPKGYMDIYFFNADDPLILMKDISELMGPAVLPPRWALGYMQSHRTLENDEQLLEVVETFREKEIPVDAVIYLGTGFCPQGWNTEQPSFDFNPQVFKRSPEEVIADLHIKNVKVALHIVPWDRDQLPTLHGNIPASEGEVIDAGHISNYWAQHLGLINSGVDAFWPDEGDWFNLDERIKRHQMYYQGPLSAKPNTRPWSLHRNGYIGISKWGGWVWSGDTESSWKTLEGQIAVGINHSLSLSPYWGSDIGGFYPTEELTGELYARWFQFGAFCPSFRSHGRTWWTRLPWGWGLSDMGPLENRSNPLNSELNNPEIEKICRIYGELRYQLMPYTYTLAWEARDKGLPFMRSLWIHYPEDSIAAGIGDQYLWGRDIMVAPVYEKGAVSRKLYLPEGQWYDWWSDEKVSGGKIINCEVDLSVMPLYVRAGSVIPVGPVRQYVDEVVEETVTIRIYPGADSHFTLYEDDGISQEYLSGMANTTVFLWNDEDRILTIKPGLLKSKSRTSEHFFTIELIGENQRKNITYKGVSTSVKF